MADIYLRKLEQTNDVFLNDPTAYGIVATEQHGSGNKLWRDYEESLQRQRQEEEFDVIIAFVTAYAKDRKCRLLKAC